MLHGFLLVGFVRDTFVEFSSIFMRFIPLSRIVLNQPDSTAKDLARRWLRVADLLDAFDSRIICIDDAFVGWLEFEVIFTASLHMGDLILHSVCINRCVRWMDGWMNDRPNERIKAKKMVKVMLV